MIRHRRRHHSPSMSRPPRSTPGGQAMVEFALVIPLVVLLLVGLFDVGRVVFVNNSVSEAAREGARWGAVQNRSVNASGRSDIAQHVRDGLTGVPGPNVDVTCEDGDGNALSLCSTNRILVVTVSTPVQLATPLLDRLIGTPTVTSTSKVTVNQ